MAVGLNDTLLNIGNAAMQTAATHAGLFTAEPNSTGTTNVAASARQAITWVTAANGDLVITADMAFTGGAASGACTHVGLWSQLATGGTFYGYFALTGDTTFNAAGEYTVTGVTITGTAT
jgi:hypothetical protein